MPTEKPYAIIFLRDGFCANWNGQHGLQSRNANDGIDSRAFTLFAHTTSRRTFAALSYTLFSAVLPFLNVERRLETTSDQVMVLRGACYGFETRL